MRVVAHSFFLHPVFTDRQGIVVRREDRESVHPIGRWSGSVKGAHRLPTACAGLRLAAQFFTASLCEHEHDCNPRDGMPSACGDIPLPIANL
jgi:hypothetical protein